MSKTTVPAGTPEPCDHRARIGVTPDHSTAILTISVDALDALLDLAGALACDRSEDDLRDLADGIRDALAEALTA